MSEGRDTHTGNQQINWRCWRPPRWLLVGTIAMVIALVITVLLIADLYPGIWKYISPKRVAMLIGIGVALTVFIISLALGAASLGWGGFGGKKLWDWLDLLVVPVFIALSVALLGGLQ